MSRKYDFNSEDKIKCLLWCDRHCCLCEKNCGTDIEVAHIDRKLNNIDNAIPLCYECHAKVGHYNNYHPKGNKYGAVELKSRREQIYEKYTSKLVPPVDFQITQILATGQKRQFPDIGFNIFHVGDSLPVKALVYLELFVGGRALPKLAGHYYGEEFWNLNPRMGFQGHFSAPNDVLQKNSERFEIKVNITIVDQYERYHKLLPVDWVYEGDGNYWWANP